MLSSVLLLAAAAIGQADAAAASGADLLKEYGQAMVGRWHGEVTFRGDAASAEGKAEKVSARAVIRWIVNEKALEGESQIGDMKTKWILGWDPVSGKLRSMGADSSGAMTESTLTKEDGAWVWTLTNLLTDGTKRSNTDIMIIRDEGKTHVHEGTSIGAKLGNYRGVWKRIEQNEK